MTIEDQIRDTLRSKAEVLPDPDSIPDNLKPTRSRIGGPLTAVAAAVMVVTVAATPLLVSWSDSAAPSAEDAAAAGSEEAATTTPSVPQSDDPVAYALGVDLEGWEIRSVSEQSGNRAVIVIDLSNGPADQEGVLPGMMILTGPLAESQLAEIEDGSTTPKWTFEIQGIEAAVTHAGTDENGLESGVIVWRTPQGQAIWVEYGRVAHETASELLQTVRPIYQTEWDTLIDSNVGPDIDTFQQP